MAFINGKEILFAAQIGQITGGSVPEWDGTLTKLITFTIDGTKYQAVEDMTWGEWVADTNYNTDGYTVEAISIGHCIAKPNASTFVCINNDFVVSNENIISNGEYTTMASSGSSGAD